MVNYLTPGLNLAQGRTKRVGGTCDVARHAPRQRLHVDRSPVSAYPSTSVAWGFGFVDFGCRGMGYIYGLGICRLQVSGLKV